MKKVFKKSKSFNELRERTFVYFENKENSLIKRVSYRKVPQEQLDKVKEICKNLTEDDFSNVSQTHELFTGDIYPIVTHRVRVESPKLNGGYLIISIQTPLVHSKFTKTYAMVYRIWTPEDGKIISGNFQYSLADGDEPLTAEDYKIFYQMAKEIVLNFQD